MDRALPEFNTILHKKWNAERKRQHKRGLLESRPLVDNGLPTAYKHPIVKSKKEMIIEGKKIWIYIIINGFVTFEITL